MAKRDWSRVINIVAFVAVVLIGIFLLLNALDILTDLSSAFLQIANVLAYFTVAVCAFFYAYSKWGKKQQWYMIVWAIAVVLIVLHYVIPALS